MSNGLFVGFFGFYLINNITVDHSHLYKPEAKLSPPFDGLSNEWIGDTELIQHVYAIHAVVIDIYYMWLLNLEGVSVSGIYCHYHGG